MRRTCNHIRNIRNSRNYHQQQKLLETAEIISNCRNDLKQRQLKITSSVNEPSALSTQMYVNRQPRTLNPDSFCPLCNIEKPAGLPNLLFIPETNILHPSHYISTKRKEAMMKELVQVMDETGKLGSLLFFCLQSFKYK